MEFNVRHGVQRPGHRKHGDKLVAALEPFHPGAGVSDTGNVEVWITVQAENARQAAKIGLVMAEDASTAEPAALEVITAAEFDRRQLVTPCPS